MIKFENTEVFGWEHAIRGMRNPKNSWNRTDSFECPSYLEEGDCAGCMRIKSCAGFNNSGVVIGPNDMNLMKGLRDAGTDHRKYLRMIAVYVDITAPLYWWKEFDTYKVGTVANSCSTMHRLAHKKFELSDFSCEHISIRQSTDMMKETIDCLNVFRDVYLMGGPLNYENGELKYFEPGDKEIWLQMIQLLPSSYNQKRTVMLNYEVLNNIYKSRKKHKLDEWAIGFMEWIDSLPYAKELIKGE